jgi:phosphotransferase system IIB component
MTTLKDIQDAIDNKTFDPNKLNQREKLLVDEAIKKGFLKGPSVGEIQQQRYGAAKDVATMKAAEENPIGMYLKQQDSILDGRSEAVLAGDLIGSITPYVTMRKKIFSAAKSKIPGDKYTGLFARTKMFSNMADNLTTKLPGRFKLLGGALKLIARAADPTVGRVVASPLGQAEIYSVLGGTAGAGMGSVGYDVLNETAGTLVMDAIAEDMKDMPPREVNTNMLANAADAMFTAGMWNAGAATLTPFITKGLGKVGRAAMGAKSKDAKELVAIARDKGLPLPLVMTAQENVGLLGGFANKFFKVVGIMPFINGIGKEALQGAEQKAGREYLNNSVLNYGPLIKTGMLSATVWKQAEQAFIENSNLINASYKGFEALATTIKNPKIIPTEHVRKMAAEYVDQLAMQYPGIRQYATDKLGDINLKELEKLRGTGDPLATFFRYANQLEDTITPLQYKGLMETMNNAISSTTYQNIRPTLWSIREALENDLNSFGANITKETFMKDAAFKESYENLAKTVGKEAADADLNLVLKQSEQLKDQLYRANDTFSTLMNFYQDANITRVFKGYDSTAFTNKALAGIGGVEVKKSQKFFNDLANDVFTNGTPKGIIQFKQLLGVEKIVSRKTGREIGITKGGGQALYDAAKARWMFNTFIKSFDSTASRAGRSMIDEITEDATVKTGINGTVDVMEAMAQRGGALDFDITKVKTGANIFDATKIKFSPKDTSQFNINKFMRNLGISDIVDDVANDKMTAILGSKGKAKEFEKFLTYMKAVSDTPIADTSTFMQRRLQLGGLNSFAGAVVLGGSAAVNPFAPALFVLLGRRAGQILTDPIAMKAWNDALNPEEQIALLMGKKVGDGVPGVLGIGRRYFKGRDIQTAANVLQKPSVIGRLGLTQKREAFARLMNYLNESDADVPRVNAKDVNPNEITERLLQLDALVPSPNYNEKTLPKKNFQVLFADDFSGSSGNLEIDNNSVNMLRAATGTEAMVEEAEAPIEQVEKTSVMEDLEFESPVQPQPMVQGTPDTGQVTPQQVQALFPNDTTSALIAARRQGQA